MRRVFLKRCLKGCIVYCYYQTTQMLTLTDCKRIPRKQRIMTLRLCRDFMMK